MNLETQCERVYHWCFLVVSTWRLVTLWLSNTIVLVNGSLPHMYAFVFTMTRNVGYPMSMVRTCARAFVGTDPPPNRGARDKCEAATFDISVLCRVS